MRQSQGLASQAPEGFPRKGPSYRRCELAYTVLGDLADEQEMPTYDTLFKTIEDYKNITIEALTYSKIGKGESWVFVNLACADEQS
jgi:hypothetical protein